MPTASLARLEKQASLDANDPLKQGIVIIEHKIRNLEKRKLKLDGYRELQESGKVLNSDQLEAIAKYDAVLAHLDFAKELSKQLVVLAADSAKTIKKQARKEAAERAQQELARTKEFLIINDVLASMGQQTVRDDLLGGKAKVTVTEEELQSIDDLYEELTPKKEEPMAFLDMFQTPAETMHHLMEGKNKEVFGSTYLALKTKLMEIATSGYFDTAAPVPEVEETPEVVEPEPVPAPDLEEPLPPREPVTEPQVQLNQVVPPQTQPQPIVSHTFQPNKGQPSMAQVHPADVDPSIVTAIPAGQPIPSQTAQQIETAYFTPSHLRVFQSGTIDFMQDNEIDPPENTEAAPSAIPTMTFANQSFSSEPQVPHIPPAAHHIDMQQPYQNVDSSLLQQTDEEKGWSTTGGNSIELEQPAAPVQQPQQPANAWTSLPTEPAPTQNLGGSGDDDWASQTEQWSQNQVNPAMSNDGFITAGSGRGRGSRGRGGGGGGDRNNKGGYNGNRGNGPRNNTGGRGGYRGGEREGGYNRDREGGYNKDGGYTRDRESGYNRDGGYNKDREGGFKDREGGYNKDREGGYNKDREGGGYYKDQNNSGGYQNGYQSGRSNRGGGGAPRQSQDRQGGGGGRGGGGRGRGGGFRGGSGNPGGNYRQ